jgi:hypothetical protein
MSVSCPSMEWPSTLEEIGPTEDAAIMLSGSARVGRTPFRVVAIRVEPRLRFTPDYRPDLKRAVYDSKMLETLLEEMGEVADTDNLRTVELATGSYVMWMAPAPETG